MKKKILLASIIALSLALLVAVGSTIAWLYASTQDITNTFLPSDIAVDLQETKGNEFQMIPGMTINKDPKAAVISPTNVDAYLFVIITKSANFDTYMSYALADGWTPVETTATTVVICREITNAEIGTYYPILKDDTVIVSPNVTKEQMKAVGTNPTLTFKAYAVQLYKDNTTKFTPAEAWASATTPTT